MSQLTEDSDVDEIDFTIEIFVAIIFCIMGAVFYSMLLKDIYVAEVESSVDKISTTYYEVQNPLEMTGYQVYMLGYMIDNYGPIDNSGVVFTDDSDGNAAFVYISPLSFQHSYTVRNKMISSRTTKSVATILDKGITTNVTDLYRGFSTVKYTMSLSSEYTDAVNTAYEDKDVNLISSDGKEYLWTVHRE